MQVTHQCVQIWVVCVHHKPFVFRKKNLWVYDRKDLSARPTNPTIPWNCNKSIKFLRTGGRFSLILVYSWRTVSRYKSHHPSRLSLSVHKVGYWFCSLILNWFIMLHPATDKSIATKHRWNEVVVAVRISILPTNTILVNSRQSQITHDKKPA